MPTSDDLMGLGLPAGQAELLGAQPSAVTCAGTAQGTATTIKTAMATLTASGGATGAKWPTTAKLGTEYFVATSSTTSAVVYVPSGHTLNGSLNGSLTVAQNKMASFLQISKGVWYSQLTA